MLTWWSVWGLAAPALTWPLRLISLISPCFVTSLLLYVSGVPLLEKSQNERYGHDPEFQKYLQNTRLLLPLPRSFSLPFSTSKSSGSGTGSGSGSNTDPSEPGKKDL
mmetsp:Transcript_40526/g.41359  ORF Transcript_40526/g.41359 Transcript_40526/m.41359 type:complete len:107 (+) Transcript_40526:732-1052(+)